MQDDPDNIKARNSDTFWRMLKRCGVRFLRAKPDHQCKIHKDAPANKRQLATAQDDLVNMREALNAARADADAKNVERVEAKIPLLRQKISKLEKAVEHARIHFIHYETALKYVKGIEYNLQTGQVLIYRDFVNQYSETGKKINNLIFVVIRPSPDGCGNFIDYVNNFAQAKCTSSFHATALDKLCQRADLLPPGTKLYISGDHGPHFWSWDTLMWQSTIFEKYKIKVEIVGLCSYHAYNRCDTHGAMIKKAAYRASTKGGGPVTSAEFRALVANIPAAEQRGITVCSSILMIISYLCFQAEDFGNLSVRDFPNKLLPRRAPSAGGIKTMVCHVCVQPCCDSSCTDAVQVRFQRGGWDQ